MTDDEIKRRCAVWKCRRKPEWLVKFDPPIHGLILCDECANTYPAFRDAARALHLG